MGFHERSSASTNSLPWPEGLHRLHIAAELGVDGAHHGARPFYRASFYGIFFLPQEDSGDQDGEGEHGQSDAQAERQQ